MMCPFPGPRFFGILIDIIDKWGGDIMKFSGDAVTILFPADTPELETTAPIHAACCCQEIHEKLSHFTTPAEGVYFSFHIGVGFGECTTMQVGGILGRFEYCATGPAFPQIAIAEPIAVSYADLRLNMSCNSATRWKIFPWSYFGSPVVSRAGRRVEGCVGGLGRRGEGCNVIRVRLPKCRHSNRGGVQRVGGWMQ